MSSSVTRPSKQSILKKKISQTDWSHDTKFIKKLFFEKNKPKKKPLQDNKTKKN
jgi:hypothetical protein